MVLVILGILALAGGIALKVLKKANKAAIGLIAGGVVFALIGVIFGGGGSEEDPVYIEDPDTFVEVPGLDGLKADDDSIAYDTPYVSVNIRPDESTEELEPDQNPVELHPEDTITGVTEEGVQWSTAKTDGTAPIHMNVNGKPVTAEVKPKQNSAGSSSGKTETGKTDAGKAAEAASVLLNAGGYTKGSDNYRKDYAILYIEPAQCLVYYPAQLKMSAAYENNSYVFTDSRSKAKLKIDLGENDFTCMDEIESLIDNTESNKVLASGTDWYSCESKGKEFTAYSVTGLGQKFSVNVELTYENKYDFVFNELRKLIKCTFIEGGKWVSNAKASTVGQKVNVLQNRYDNGMSWKTTSWYFDEWDCVLYYPDVFTKAYQGDNGVQYFTDPVTGAYISMMKKRFDGTLQDLIGAYDLNESDINGEIYIRGTQPGSGFTNYHYIALRDGYEYHATMHVSSEYSKTYESASNTMKVVLPADDVSTVEMQDLYFPTYHCYITVPLEFVLKGSENGRFFYRDRFNGMEMSVTFTDIPKGTDTGNIFNMFEVTADDSDITVGNNVVKWHNQNGLCVGGVGYKYTCLMEMSYPNAGTAYELVWKRMNIRFEETAKAQTVADKIENEIEARRIEKETQEVKTAVNETKPQPTAALKPSATGNNNPTVTLPAMKPEKEETPQENVDDKAAVTPAIIAEPVKNELPGNDDWIYDDVANVVLWYRDADDYNWITSTAEQWFEYDQSGPSLAEKSKYITLMKINSILIYNEYKFSVSSSWVEYEALPAVDDILYDWYSRANPVGSQMGEGITSVFEAYCEVLEIDVPDYISNAILPKASVNKPADTGDTRPTASPTSEPVNPGTDDNDEDEFMDYVIGTWKLDQAGSEMPEFARFTIDEDGKWTGTGGKSAYSGTIKLEHPDGYLERVTFYDETEWEVTSLSYSGADTMGANGCVFVRISSNNGSGDTESGNDDPNGNEDPYGHGNESTDPVEPEDDESGLDYFVGLYESDRDEDGHRYVLSLNNDSTWVYYTDMVGKERGTFKVVDDQHVTLYYSDNGREYGTLTDDEEEGGLYNPVHDEYLYAIEGLFIDEEDTKSGNSGQVYDKAGFDKDLAAIVRRTGRSDVYEEIAAALGIGIMGEPYRSNDGYSYEIYGNVNDIYYADVTRMSEFIKGLENRGFTYSGAPNIGSFKSYSYKGVVPGYEKYGKVHVVVCDYETGSGEIFWIFGNYATMTHKKGEIHIDSDVNDMWRFSQVFKASVYNSGLSLYWIGYYSSLMYEHVSRMRGNLDEYYIRVGSYSFYHEAENGTSTEISFKLCKIDEYGGLYAVYEYVLEGDYRIYLIQNGTPVLVEDLSPNN